LQKFEIIKKLNIIDLQFLIYNLTKNMDFSKAWEMMKLQQEAMKVKKELENTFIEAEVNWLVITVNWEMKVEKVEFETENLIPWLSASQKIALESAIKEAINKWVKKSQEVAAEKMQWVMQQMWMWNMWLPGMK